MQTNNISAYLLFVLSKCHFFKVLKELIQIVRVRTIILHSSNSAFQKNPRQDRRPNVFLAPQLQHLQHEQVHLRKAGMDFDMRLNRLIYAQDQLEKNSTQLGKEVHC